MHATAIAIGSRAALIRGPSGSGKSDLALRCLAQPISALNTAPARLVGDDQILITRRDTRLIASAPDTLKGMIEIRGIGIATLDTIDEADIALVVDLVPANGSAIDVARMADPWPTVTILGVSVPHLWLRPFEASAALKILLALEGKAVVIPAPRQ